VKPRLVASSRTSEYPVFEPEVKEILNEFKPAQKRAAIRRSNVFEAQ